jgi:hypothetical protein
VRVSRIERCGLPTKSRSYAKPVPCILVVGTEPAACSLSIARPIRVRADLFPNRPGRLRSGPMLLVASARGEW